MRKLFLSFSTVLPCFVILASLAGCPKKTDEAPDASVAEAGAAAVTEDAAPAAPVAKNAGDVARFPSELPLADDDARTVDAFTQARTGPKSSNNVALIKAGSDVFKMAEFQDAILVTFADPKDATVTLMGWIPKGAFSADAVALAKDAGAKDAGGADAAVGADAAAPPADAGVAPAALKCPVGQEFVKVLAGGGAACRKKCAVDKDCKTPTAHACAPATTDLGKLTRVCAAEAP